MRVARLVVLTRPHGLLVRLAWLACRSRLFTARAPLGVHTRPGCWRWCGGARFGVRAFLAGGRITTLGPRSELSHLLPPLSVSPYVLEFPASSHTSASPSRSSIMTACVSGNSSSLWL